MNIPIQNIYIMLIYSWQKHNEKDIVKVDLEGQTSLQNLFAKVLINGVNHLFKRGVNRDYRSVNEGIRTIKGKIDFNTSIKKNLFINGMAQCEFDEFDEDNIQNQIIKATISKLIRTDDVDSEHKRKLAHLRRRFAKVSNIGLRKSHFSGLKGRWFSQLENGNIVLRISCNHCGIYHFIICEFYFYCTGSLYNMVIGDDVILRTE